MYGLKKLCSGVLAALILIPALSYGAEAWEHRRKLLLDTTPDGADIKAAAAQVPVLVRLHTGNFKFAQAKPDGSDLRFVGADGKTPLKFHIEQYDTQNELANIWVLVPKLNANTANEGIFLDWGNKEATAQSDSKSSYDASQVLVYHFSEQEGVKDATANANHPKEATVKPVTAGPIAQAAAFDGGGQIAIPASGSLKIRSSDGLTFSAWVKPAAIAGGKLYVQRDGDKSFSIGISNGSLTAAFGSATVKSAVQLKPGIWQHVAVAVSSGKAHFYVDGTEAGNAPLEIDDMAGEATIGEGFSGEMDEAGLASTARPAEFIRALAMSQMADSLMVGFDEGSEEEAGASYVSILLSAVTIDGWIVIAILAVMAVVSFWVMFSKSMYLAKTNKANRLFLEQFQNKSEALLSPGHPEAALVASDTKMRQSSIYHLYEIGLREVTQRLEKQRKAGQGDSLSGSALDAIRASLEAAMMRQNQKINSGIVLLTIAISGGPFLGLLGTVVGVMITFAAIAAAGDVNVNSIAPGIAAALVATVAGLAVAIPALFGYNWLAAQIKNISADASVFTDEFLTKSAEIHSA